MQLICKKMPFIQYYWHLNLEDRMKADYDDLTIQLKGGNMPAASKKSTEKKPSTAKKTTPKPTTKKVAPANTGKPLTKTQIVGYLAEVNNLTRKQVMTFLDSFTELACKETKKNQKFTIPGLGILKLSKRKARMGRNPATGEAIKIPAKTVVKLTVAKSCKEAILGPSKK